MGDSHDTAKKIGVLVSGLVAAGVGYGQISHNIHYYPRGISRADTTIRNSPFEVKWIKAKAQIRKFNCQENENCSILARMLAGIKDPLVVNVAVNRLMRYKLEPEDKWGNPDSIFTNRFGDCEDFVIAKIALMKELGFDLDGINVYLMHRKADSQFHLSLSYNGVIMDFQNIDSFRTVFTMKFNQTGLKLFIS